MRGIYTVRWPEAGQINVCGVDHRNFILVVATRTADLIIKMVTRDFSDRSSGSVALASCIEKQ